MMFSTNSSTRSTGSRIVLLLLYVGISTIIHCSINTVVEGALDQPFRPNYANIPHAPCVSLFYRMGRIGCSTEDHTSVQIGKLIYYNGALPDGNDPYVVLVEDYAMTANTIKTLQQDQYGRLQGILVLNSTSLNTGNVIYSPDTPYPLGINTPSSQINYGYNVQYKWNSRGEDLINLDLHGIPIAFIMDSDIAQELRFEGQYPTGTSRNSMVAEINYYMGPSTMDSGTCLAWKDVSNDAWNPKCLPLGGLSVWAHTGTPPPPSNNNANEQQQQQQQPVILVGAGMDSTNLYHDLSTGSNTAASNIITILMAAKLIGTYMSDQEFDALPNRIVLSLFQGETYGFIGSRSFIRDMEYPGFSCNSDLVPSFVQLGDQSEWGCLNPPRHNMRFNDMGNIKSMLSIDQIGHAVATGMLYVHGEDGSSMVNLLKYTSTYKFSVVASSAADTGYGYPYPPSPLTSLLSLSGGTIGGAVLTGYDYDFPSKIPYHSQNDIPSYIELQTIAAAATIVARTAIAAAFDDGTYSGQGDYSTPTAYAKNKIPELAYNDASLMEVANCFLYNGNCDLITKYSTMEVANAKSRTGVGIEIGESITNTISQKPNYYVGIYSFRRGQTFVQVGDNVYGAYNGSDYGKKKSDYISLQPKQLENTIYGLFNDYLGRGSISSSDGSTPTTNSCKQLSDCSNVENLCKKNAYDVVTCSGSNTCVCVRAQYHTALDESIVPTEQMPTGYFSVVSNNNNDNNNNNNVSPMYTEPFWSSSVGIRIYRQASSVPGYISLFVGLAFGGISLFGALVLRVGLRKEKLY